MAHISYKKTISAMFTGKEGNIQSEIMHDDGISEMSASNHIDLVDVENNGTTNDGDRASMNEKKSAIPHSISAVTLAFSSSDDDSKSDASSLHKRDQNKEKSLFCFTGRCVLYCAIILMIAVAAGTASGKYLVKSNSPKVNPSISPVSGSNSTQINGESMDSSSFPTSSIKPSSSPSFVPSTTPSIYPSFKPSSEPSVHSSNVPTSVPSLSPTMPPTDVPTQATSSVPSSSPTASPTSFPTKSPTLFPTKSPTLFPTKSPPTNIRVTNAEFSKTNTDLVVGVYYYPWYSNTEFHGRKYVRYDISPKQLPAIGEYNQEKIETISKHLEMTRKANVNLWVSSWWGPGDATDKNTIGIMNNEDFPGTKLALLYETLNRVQNGNLNNVYNDFAHITKTYFNNPNYFRVNGCPAVYLYLARDLDRRGILDNAVNLMRNAAKDNGHCIYLVGDVAYGRPEPSGYRPYELLDAITEYDVFGSMGRPRYAGQEGVNNFRDKQAGWRKNAIENGCGFIPSVTPGYNEKGVRNNQDPMSRKLTAGSNFGTLFQALLANAVQLTDQATGDILMVNSFNEWHEDTQIEPVGGSGVTTSPNSKTAGLEYEAYGERYLNILAAETNRR